MVAPSLGLGDTWNWEGRGLHNICVLCYGGASLSTDLRLDLEPLPPILKKQAVSSFQETWSIGRISSWSWAPTIMTFLRASTFWWVDTWTMGDILASYRIFVKSREGRSRSKRQLTTSPASSPWTPMLAEQCPAVDAVDFIGRTCGAEKTQSCSLGTSCKMKRL